MTTLIVCDIDGVLLDARGRDFLAPCDKTNTTNAAWKMHQDAINNKPDPAFIHGIDIVNRLYGTVGSKMIYLTSRIETAMGGTIRDFKSYGIPAAPIYMRSIADEMPPAQYKAHRLADILDDVYYRDINHVIFIDDHPANLNEVMKLAKAGAYRIPVERFMPVLLQPEKWV